VSDWQVGDLAVCVDDSPRYVGHRVIVEKGHVYRVTGVAEMPDGEAALFLDGVIGWLPGEKCPVAYRIHRFRKIRPDEREACEPEFVTLLQRIKRKEVA
jgi:hypothetical protein